MEKAFRCTNCGGLYEVMVSQCDCMPQQQQFVEQAVMPWADAVQLTAERDRLKSALTRLRHSWPTEEQTVWAYAGEVSDIAEEALSLPPNAVN